MSAGSGWNRLGDQIGERGWLLAAVWLVFLAFPLAAIWSDPVSLATRLVVTGLILAFAAVYIHGFKTLAEAEETCLNPTDSELDELVRPWWAQHPGSLPHFIVLVAITVIAVSIGGWGMLGMLAFIAAFAMFQLSWPAAGITVAATLVATLVGPALQGFLSEVWFFAATVASISLFSAMIRIADERHIERTAFRTQLAISDERSRVARDVHDVLGHSLTVITLKAELCQRLLDIEVDDSVSEDSTSGNPTSLHQARQELSELQAISRQALAEIRTTVGGLRTADLSDELAAARAVLGDAGVSLTVTGDHTALPTDQRGVLAWVVRESVTNIVRHAEAKTCEIAFALGRDAASESDGSRPVLQITDDGVGLQGEPEGNGLSGLRDRVAGIGGSVLVSSATAPSSGTSLEVTL